MAKYACDTAAVLKAGKKIVEIAEDTSSNYLDSVEKMDASLQNWSGDAQDSYLNAELQRAQTTINSLESLRNFGFYLQFVAKTIDEAEDELASQNI